MHRLWQIFLVAAAVSAVGASLYYQSGFYAKPAAAPSAAPPIAIPQNAAKAPGVPPAKSAGGPDDNDPLFLEGGDEK